ncbi:hypothetical protein [Pseudooceanicola sp.]|uniref:hypothetical protein n=1 Tax=Pseudooceanicola sp. TaxID=1914328 RepID=UPI0035C663B1
MIRYLVAVVLSALPGLAQASDYSCNFKTECYESEACAESNFTVAVRGGEDKFVTDFGTFPILAKRDTESILTVFVRTDGAVYLLSAGPRAARLTVHITDGPQSLTYLGLCEKVG